MRLSRPIPLQQIAPSPSCHEACVCVFSTWYVCKRPGTCKATCNFRRPTIHAYGSLKLLAYPGARFGRVPQSMVINTARCRLGKKTPAQPAEASTVSLSNGCSSDHGAFPFDPTYLTKDASFLFCLSAYVSIYLPWHLST